MVDVGIRFRQTPHLRIRVKTTSHILIHQKLEVEPRMPISPNKDVRADASSERNVAAWEGNTPVTAIVNGGHANLLISHLQNAFIREKLLCAGQSRGKREQEKQYRIAFEIRISLWLRIGTKRREYKRHRPGNIAP
jgi:hypothetical protein